MTNKLLSSLLLLLFSTPLIAATESIESADLTLIVETVESEGIRLVSLTDKAIGHVFCSAPSRPLFTLVLCDPTERKELYVQADKGWSHVAMEKKENVLHLSWKGRKWIPDGGNISVAMQIVADPTKAGIEISQTAVAGSDKVSIVSMRLGQIAVKDFGTSTKLFYPLRSGMVYADPCEKKIVQNAGYLGFNVPMPWCVVWNEQTPEKGFRSSDNIGLYVGFHDPDGCRKTIDCVAIRKKEGYNWPDTVSFWATVQAENMYEPNNDFKIGGKAVLRTIRNNWYDGATIYRDWVRKEASWYPRDKMDENGRTDTPQWFKELCLWTMHRANPEDMAVPIKKCRDAFGVPMGIHWYYWNTEKYDYDYPHFTPRDGFKAAVDEMQKDGDVFVMPYINGYTWDTRRGRNEASQFTPEVASAAVKDENGSIPSRTGFVAMCPTTQVWQRKNRENVLRLTNEYGTKAVYLDQVAAMAPRLCYDRSHGHPLGGGHWWKDGYQTMFEMIRTDWLNPNVQDHPLGDAVKERLRSNPNALRERVLTSESTAETYLSIFDGFLTWHHQLENQVPAFAAVYGGAIQMIGRDYRFGKDYAERTVPGLRKMVEPLACRMKTAESLCFGTQIGWFVPTIIEEADKFPFQRAAVRLRYQIRHYFYKGEMCRPPDLPSEMPMVTADWNFYDSSRPITSTPVTAPAVRTGCWRIVKDGKTQSAIILFANTSAEPVTSRFRVDLAEIGFDKNVSIRQIGPEGVEKTIDVDALNQPVVFPGEGVFAWEINL